MWAGEGGDKRREEEEEEEGKRSAEKFSARRQRSWNVSMVN